MAEYIRFYTLAYSRFTNTNTRSDFLARSKVPIRRPLVYRSIETVKTWRFTPFLSHCRRFCVCGSLDVETPALSLLNSLEREEDRHDWELHLQKLGSQGDSPTIIRR